jgi:hypothetical protein
MKKGKEKKAETPLLDSPEQDEKKIKAGARSPF